MTKQRQFSYTAKDRKAEQEIDRFLSRINGSTPLDIMKELKDLSA